jgi:Do/DeqQ family serine protease
MYTMKNFFSYLFAAILGGIVVFAAGQLWEKPQTVVVQEKPQWVKPASFPTEKPAILTSAPASFSVAAEKALPAVVNIKTQESEEMVRRRLQSRTVNPWEYFFGGGMSDQFYQRQGSGSGVIISSDGYIVTNNHVVEFGDIVEVTLPDTRTFIAEKIGTDPNTDMAVLKIEADNLPAIEYGNSDDIKIGDWVLAVGNPFSYLTSTVTAGIVSAKGRDLDLLNERQGGIESFIQTDAAVNPGNSGGALVDQEGRLVGINTAIATPTGSFAGYSFAIPVNLMEKIVNDIIQYGEYRKAFLGVEFTELNAEIARDLEIEVNNGILIRNVVEGSSADYAGLLPYDIITNINGREIKASSELLEKIGSARVGETLNIEVLRNGRRQNIPVVMRKVKS